MPEQPSSTPPPSDGPIRFWTPVRLVLLGLLCLAIVGGLVFVFATPQGAALRDNPRQAAAWVQEWVQSHPVSAPMVLLGVYLALSILMLPVWPLQVLSGYGMGLIFGTLACIAGATMGAVAAWGISRWLGGDWLRQRLESRAEKLRHVSEAMGHNGLMVVLCVRAIHVLPFGLSNYLFGISRIRGTAVALGTLLGNLPAIVLYVAMGADLTLLKRPLFWTILAAIQLAVLVPIGAKYWRHRPSN